VLIDRLIESILPGGSKFGKLAQDVCGRIYMCLAADFFQKTCGHKALLFLNKLAGCALDS
jgi:hypothetical protein